MILLALQNRKKVTCLALAMVFFISIPPRLWKLTSYPPVIVDEPANLRDITKLHNLGINPIDFEWGFAQSILVFYPTLILIGGGIHNQFFALRLTSVILSLISLIPFFFIVKRYSNTLTAFCTTLLFSYSYYFLQFSRVGWTNIHTLTIGLFLLWIFDLMLEKKSYTLSIISGILMGLLLYVYRGGEIYIGACLIYSAVKITTNKALRTFLIRCVFISICTAIFVGFPWIKKIATHWELYNLRANIVSIYHTDYPYHNLSNFRDIMIYQFATTIKSWVLMLPTPNTDIEGRRYLPINYPIISWPIALFFLTGFILSMKLFKKLFPWHIIFFTGLYFGQILTVDPPNGSRGLIVLPIIYFFIGLTIFTLQKKLKNISYISFIILVLSILLAYRDFLFYQWWMSWIRV